MDMFSRLPTLVHTTILGQIQSDRDLFSLIRASPQSLQLYARYRCTVARQRLARFLELDTDGNMIQDALAIINFPRINQSSPIPLAIMSDWFDMLNTRSFNYRHSIDSLYPFFTRLVVFIEDYLAKSLDPFPVRACMTLPTIGRSAPCMQFKGKETDVKPVSFGMFPAHTQRRLLQAFISYELRCKIYDPRVWDPLERNSYASMVDRLNERLTLSDCEELHCVFEYIKSMYGAVKAQSTDDTWFPDRQVPNPTVQSRPRNDEDADLPSARDLGLLYPDNLYFDGALRSIPRKLDILSCLGLDLLSSIIQNSRFDDGTGISIDTHITHLTFYFSDKAWIIRDPFNYNHRLLTSRSRLRSWLRDMPLAVSRRHGDYRGYVRQRKQDLELQVLQSKIYRQRGWIFFRDSPGPQPILPSAEHIVEEYDSVSDWICLELEKHRRRSQKWQDYWAGRTLDDPLDPDSPANQSSPTRCPEVYAFSTFPRFFSGRTA
ncbi:hypothetical protein FG05_30493 [Fusarium graminearum]|nr:hypothetical protein FG05_30493 [Fusarium graminearum]